MCLMGLMYASIANICGSMVADNKYVAGVHVFDVLDVFDGLEVVASTANICGSMVAGNKYIPGV